MKDFDDRPEVIALLDNIKMNMPKLEELLEKCNKEHTYEDGVYRFYHGSFKVEYIQRLTSEIVSTLKNLSSDNNLNRDFLEIISEGTEKTFNFSWNLEWLKHTRPLLEAFFHAKFFLEMAVKYGKELDKPPNLLPSGWAALLYLYNLR